MARTLALLVVRNRIVEGGAASRTGAYLTHSTCAGAQLATRVINTVLGGPAEGAIAVGPKTNPACLHVGGHLYGVLVEADDVACEACKRAVK